LEIHQFGGLSMSSGFRKKAKYWKAKREAEKSKETHKKKEEE
jgi:hypothetical protein